MQSNSHSPTTLTVNLHFASFPERSVEDRKTMVEPILNFIGEEKNAFAGTDSSRGRKPELSEIIKFGHGP
jgi:hypothetical protein